MLPINRLLGAESVADRSQSVNSKLQQRRDHIEELNQVPRDSLQAPCNIKNTPQSLEGACQPLIAPGVKEALDLDLVSDQQYQCVSKPASMPMQA